ncbi:MAG: hypothetical protein AAGJ18_18715, partial [Bacteroidota bacterium]
LKPSIKNYKQKVPNGNFGLRGKKVFPIYFSEDKENKVLLYSRGNEIIKKPNSYLKKIVTNLNNGEILTFESLKKCLMPEWDLVDVYSFVSELMAYEAIKIVDVKSMCSINKIALKNSNS